MTFDELKQKALSLPYEPGVYIMRNKDDTVIYVGKAKKLKNRVSQYFQDTASHSPKTRLMVSKIHHFEVIIAASEFEALVLECSLIKRYMPKYNILLKDDKGYPFLRLDQNEAYPKIAMVSKVSDDGAEYFGPFGNRGVTQNVLEAIIKTFRLPDCNRVFPRDIGKSRPCLNYHMNLCAGWCQENTAQDEYRNRIHQARQLLMGEYKAVASDIRTRMLKAAEDLDFEGAATLRDQLNAVEALGKKQTVTALSKADTDVIGYGETETKACFAILHFSEGNLLDKEYEVFPRPENSAIAVSSLIKQYYLRGNIAPKRLLIPLEMEDAALFSLLLEKENGRKTQFLRPQRGENLRLIELANKNAQEEAERLTDREERVNATLAMLGKMLDIEPPERIESYDISNISGTDIVAGMVVFENGKPKKSEYKRFQLKDMAGQDDYASMRQVLERRFGHYKAGDTGFDASPSLLLIDGGVNHAQIALSVLIELGLSFPVFGMVKDNRHRTRALVTPQGGQIAIDNNQAVFSFVGAIQEETHRFAISYHRQKRSKRLRYSQLDAISGIGPKRKQDLLRKFGSISAIAEADIDQLRRILPRDAATAVYEHFHQSEE